MKLIKAINVLLVFILVLLSAMLIMHRLYPVEKNDYFFANAVSDSMLNAETKTLDIPQAKKMSFKLPLDKKGYLFGSEKKDVQDSNGIKRIDLKIAQITEDVPYVLKGTIVAGAKNSYAVIKHNNKGKEILVKLGSELGSLRLVRVGKKSVGFESIDNSIKLSMDKNQAAKNKNKIKTGLFFANAPKKYLNSNVKYDVAELFSQMRIKPYFNQGDLVGYEIVNIKRGSLIEKVGLRSGDVIRKINGVSLKEPAKAIEGFYSAQKEGFLHIGIERNKKTLYIDYTIES